jgi:predicted DNA-binding antitoxin AbrB/MazE fold protein
MAKTIEVVHEDHVFKPLGPVEGLKEHERLVAIFPLILSKKVCVS